MPARFHIADDIYDFALEQMLKWEGGYVNHPNDPGGATNKGVTQAVYNGYRRRQRLTTQSVRRIKGTEVGDIYRRLYWEKGKCPELPPFLAMAHFDWCVNTGPRRAMKHLQQVVGTGADGVWGSKTRGAIERFVCDRGEDALVAAYLDRRSRYYHWLGAKKRFSVFLRGWMNRFRDLKRELRRLGWDG